MQREEGRQPGTVLVLYRVEACLLERGQEEFERLTGTQPQGQPLAVKRDLETCGTAALACWAGRQLKGVVQQTSGG